jgi:hypothetical protein
MSKPNIEVVRQAIAENADTVAKELTVLMAYLGASREWSMDDNFQTTAAIAQLADTIGLPSAGDQSDEHLAFWQGVVREIEGGSR